MSPLVRLKEDALEPREAALLAKLREEGEVDLARSSAKRYRAAVALVEFGLAYWGEGSLLLPVRRRQ